MSADAGAWVHRQAELQAEVERLQVRAAYAERVWRELGTSREQLQAEVERLKAAVVEIGAAHVAAQAEVERLRTALREIAYDANPDWWSASKAREALCEGPT